MDDITLEDTNTLAQCVQAMTGQELMSAPVRFCSFSPNRKCRKVAGKAYSL